MSASPSGRLTRLCRVVLVAAAMLLAAAFGPAQAPTPAAPQPPSPAPQDAVQAPQEPPADALAAGAVNWQDLNWIDITALSVLFVFFVLGLFKGLFWQVSRILILVLAYVGAARLGPDLGYVLHRWTASSPDAETSETAAYLAYVLVFLAVLVLLSLLALLLQSLVKKAGLTFFDRLGGGVLGVVTGACVVLFLLGVMHMFFPQSRAVQAAGRSHSLRLSQQALDRLGGSVPDQLRKVFDLRPLSAPAHETPPPNGDGPPGGR